MYITKSLFVEYRKLPKLAWWKVHDDETYKTIRKITSEEQEEYIMQIGMEAERKVWEHFEKLYGKKALDLMPWVVEPEEDEYEDEDFYLKQWFNPEKMMLETIEAIKRQEAILYQPTFLIDWCLVRWDFMTRNEDGSYTLCEVKAKTTVRKSVTDDGIKKDIWKIKQDLLDDMSFQKRVINRVLEQEWLQSLSSIQLRYLNKEYIKDGELSLNLLLTHQEVDVQHSREVIQRKKPTTLVIDDSLLESHVLGEYVNQMKEVLPLGQEEFEKRSLWTGSKYLEYFGKTRIDSFGTVMWSGINTSNASVIQDLYYEWKHDIEELTDDEIDQFNKWAQGFISNYLHVKETGKPIVETAKISEELSKFSFPICFYDYESMSSPIPFLDKTYPYQHVVVQYSLHKLYEDWTMKHYGWVFTGEWEKKVEQIVLPDHEYKVGLESEKVVTWEYKDLLVEFLKDIWDDLDTSTFVVRHKSFENKRNEEIAQIFPDLQDYLRINDATYDLKEVFSKWYYFDNGCKWSASIKNVLPVMVPSMDYKVILEEVTNGLIAMRKLKLLIDWTLEWDRDEAIERLLRYCGLDSLAMVRIYEEILRRI